MYFLAAKSTKNSPADAYAYFVPANVRNGRLFAGLQANRPRFLPLLAGTSFHGFGIGPESFAAERGGRDAPGTSRKHRSLRSPLEAVFKPLHSRLERKKNNRQPACPHRTTTSDPQKKFGIAPALHYLWQRLIQAAARQIANKFAFAPVLHYLCLHLMNGLKIMICALLLAAAGACNRTQGPAVEVEDAEEPHNMLYGINADDYRTETGEVGSGETLGKILNGFGVSALAVDRLDKASKEVFPLRNIRAGHKYTAFIHEDSLYAPHLDYLAYEISVTDYVVFGFHDDSVSVRKDAKAYTLRRTKKSAVINSSLWGAIMEQQLPYALAAELEDIYQWTVDFFGIQKGDDFTVIYDERFIDDTVSVGIGRIWGAKFSQGGKEYYAIPFRQGGKIQYWEADGASLRKQMLKAPLKYSRISSKFSYARKHPIYKVYRPHTGVDYAAPKGTPVHAVADGTVTFKGWGGGGGNTLKIKHAGNLMTGYLHLSGYAKGIVKGSRVSQGQLIGYVGSTGASTGPHLDYRVWKNGTPIDPLKIPSEPAEPIARENRALFEFVRDRITAELNGEVSPEEQITQLDSLVLPATVQTPDKQ